MRINLQFLAIIALAFGLALSGCQSGSLTYVVSPQISGRVLAADTHQPLAGANVARVQPASTEGSVTLPKGGQLLTRNSGVRTDADGRFELPAESVFAPFRQPGWWSVPVVYNATGYEMFQTNYTGTNVTSHSASGTPEVDAGDVLLQPVRQ